MDKYLDRSGLIELWSKIKSTFATKEEVNAVIDNAPENYNTLNKIATWINQYGGDADIEEAIEGRKLKYLPVQAYGFDTNLRINQVIDGASLVNEVLRETNQNKRQVIIRCGDYDYNVIAILNANDYKGFAIVNMDLNPTIENPFPALEKCVILYSVALNKTYSFYEKAYTNAEINTQIENVLNSTLIPITEEEINTICDET